MKPALKNTLIITGVILIGLCGYALYRVFFPRIIQADLIIYNGTVITMNKQREIIPHGFVAIKDSNIIAVGPADLLTTITAHKQINADENAILPGFINGHVHTAMTLFRGIMDDAPLHVWLNAYMLPLEKQYISPYFVYWGTLLGILEMIRGGTTTAVDMYLQEENAAKAFQEMGMRAIAGYNIITQEDLQAAENFIKAWQKNALVTPAVAPHTTYTCTPDIIQKSQKLANTYNVPLMMHIAESPWETEQIFKRYGKRPVPFLDSLGFLQKSLIGAHLVTIDEADMDLLKQHQVGIIHNPVSNMKLGSGIAPVVAMLKKGLTVGLGTDGAASNNSLSMLETIKITALTQKAAAHDPQALTAQTALELATIRGAQAIHREHDLGSLEVGKKADVIIISLKQIHQQPLYSVISQLVYASEASDVDTVIIDGKIVLNHKQFLIPELRIKEIIEQSHRYAQKIRSTLAS